MPPSAGVDEPTGHGEDLCGAGSLLMVAWLGLVATAGAYLLFARGLRQLSARTVGTLSLAEPLAAGVLSLLVIRERPAPAAALGALCLLAGLLLAASRHDQGSRTARAPSASRPYQER